MGLILTKPAKVGDHHRPPGYELTEVDMHGRNIDAMERLGYIKWVDDPPRRQASRDKGDD